MPRHLRPNRCMMYTIRATALGAARIKPFGNLSAVGRGCNAQYRFSAASSSVSNSATARRLPASRPAPRALARGSRSFHHGCTNENESKLQAITSDCRPLSSAANAYGEEEYVCRTPTPRRCVHSRCRTCNSARMQLQEAAPWRTTNRLPEPGVDRNLGQL